MFTAICLSVTVTSTASVCKCSIKKNKKKTDCASSNILSSSYNTRKGCSEKCIKFSYNEETTLIIQHDLKIETKQQN